MFKFFLFRNHSNLLNLFTTNYSPCQKHTTHHYSYIHRMGLFRKNTSIIMLERMNLLLKLFMHVEVIKLSSTVKMMAIVVSGCCLSVVMKQSEFWTVMDGRRRQSNYVPISDSDFSSIILVPNRLSQFLDHVLPPILMSLRKYVLMSQ